MSESEYYVNITEFVTPEYYYENSTRSYNMGNYLSEVTEQPSLQAFDTSYKSIHGYLATIVCIFGVIANILNIIILTRRNMVSSTNVILTGLAVSDGITMAMYLPYALQMYVIHGTGTSPDRDTESCARFQMSYAIVSVIMHSISIWLTVTLAVFRYVFIRFPRRGARWCNVQRAKTAVISVSVVVAVICIPNSTVYRIANAPLRLADPSYNGNEHDLNRTVWWVEIRTDSKSQVILQNFNFWVQATLIKLLPCVLLTIFSVLLVRTMQDAEKRRKKMMNKNTVVDGEKQPVGAGAKRSRRSQRTTRMLLAVVILFLVTETPQGVLNLLCGLIEEFFVQIYMPLGDLIDILTLTNNGINFVLYCTMSKQFRDTFISVFCRCCPKFVERRPPMTCTTMVGTRDSEV